MLYFVFKEFANLNKILEFLYPENYINFLVRKIKYPQFVYFNWYSF